MAKNKEITVLFQDCVLCGDRGKKKGLELEEKGYSFRKVSFATAEGRELSAQAVAAGVGSMPVFFCGDKISATLDGLFEKKKPARKNLKAKDDDGAIAEV